MSDRPNSHHPPQPQTIRKIESTKPPHLNLLFPDSGEEEEVSNDFFGLGPPKLTLIAPEMDDDCAEAEPPVEVRPEATRTTATSDTMTCGLSSSVAGARVEPSIPAPPTHIGAGRLHVERPDWRPGNPFGDVRHPRRSTRGRFRWDILMATACGTATCGVVCVWLLRALFS
jgi:hypothetical protein